MDREVGKSWARYGRRFVLRLSFKRPEEVAVMDEYDRRSKLLGKDDKEFLKDCLVVGCRLLLNKDISINTIALSTNESNNTQKEHYASVLPNESNSTGSTARSGTDQETSGREKKTGSKSVDLAVPAKSVLGNLMKHA